MLLFVKMQPFRQKGVGWRQFSMWCIVRFLHVFEIGRRNVYVFQMASRSLCERKVKIAIRRVIFSIFIIYNTQKGCNVFHNHLLLL